MSRFERLLSEVTRQRDEFIGDRNRFAAELRELRPYAEQLEGVARAVAGYEGEVGEPRPSLLWWKQCQAAARNALKKNHGSSGELPENRHVAPQRAYPADSPATVSVTSGASEPSTNTESQMRNETDNGATRPSSQRGGGYAGDSGAVDPVPTSPTNTTPQKDNASFRAAGECDHEWLPIPPNVNGFPGDALCQKCGKAGKREAAPVTFSTPEANREPAAWPPMELLKNASLADANGQPYTAAAFRAFAALLNERIATDIAREEELRDALEDMIDQFAYVGKGQRDSGGLSALEHAFRVLGLSDPHPAPAYLLCDEPGCGEQSTCGTPTPNGYRRTCSKHMPRDTSPAQGTSRPYYREALIAVRRRVENDMEKLLTLDIIDAALRVKDDTP